MLNEADLPYLRNQKPRWSIDDSLKDITTQSPLPVCSFAECLQLLANASRSVVYFDRNGTLHISHLSLFQNDVPSFAIHDGNSYSKTEIGLSKPLKTVSVSTYSWQVDTEKTIYDAELKLNPGANVFVIEYSDPAKDVCVAEITQDYADASGEINPDKVNVDFYTQCCRLEIYCGETDPTTCHIVLAGQTLKQTETIVSLEHSSTGETVSLQNILVTDTEQARDIGNWLRDRYSNRKNISVEWRVDPSMDAIDFVQASNGTLSQQARILASSFDFNGTFKGKSEGMVIE